MPFTGLAWFPACMLFTDLRTFKFEQVFSAMQRVFEGAIGIVEEGGVGQAPLALVLAGAGKAVWMHLAAEAMKFDFEGGQIDLKRARQAEDLKKIASGGRLNLAAMRAE